MTVRTPMSRSLRPRTNIQKSLRNLTDKPLRSTSPRRAAAKKYRRWPRVRCDNRIVPSRWATIQAGILLLVKSTKFNCTTRPTWTRPDTICVIRSAAIRRRVAVRRNHEAHCFASSGNNLAMHCRSHVSVGVQSASIASARSFRPAKR